MLTRQAHRATPGQSRPQLESLEDRCCPSVALQGHTLNVLGSAGGDHIIIRDGGHGNISATVVDAQGHQSSLNANGVQKLVISSLGGNDRIEYTLTASLTVAEQIVVNAGPGNNVINLNFSKGITGPSLSVQVQGSAGDDTLTTTFGSIVNTNLSFSSKLGNGFDHSTVTLNGDVTGNARVYVALTGGSNYNGMSILERGTIGAAAQVSLTAQGGNQMSTVHVDYTGKLNGKLTVQALGGSSTDWVASTINLLAGSNGSLTARENGGKGDDQLILRVNTNGNHLKTLDALVDGGGGTDYVLRTPNVRTQHVAA